MKTSIPLKKKIACTTFAIKALSLSLLFVIVTSLPATRPKIFDVRSYGAQGDGRTDNTNAFTRAWQDACAWNGRSKMYIPIGTFYLGGITFQGPCHGKITFRILGTLLAPPNNDYIKNEVWIGFRYIDYLTVSGSGTIDGQGKNSWPLINDCHNYNNCPKLAINMGFDFVRNSRIKGITSVNSKAGHLNFLSVDHFNITDVKIIAPGDSPNTDGIKIAFSSNMQISNTLISTGDDCIAILSGNTNFDIYNVTCGPGHGISIGSLGRYPNEKNVDGLTIRDTVFTDTSNGIRIKTFESSVSETIVSNLVYENIKMIDVETPIHIDQKYCPYPPCQKQGNFNIQIQNVILKNIWGTSKNKVALEIQCSESLPCKNVQLIDIVLTYNGPDGPATALCENVQGSAIGKIVPSHCLK